MALGHAVNDISNILEEEGLDIRPDMLVVALQKLRAESLIEVNVEKVASKAVAFKRTRAREAKVPALDVGTHTSIAATRSAINTGAAESERYRDIGLMLTDITDAPYGHLIEHYGELGAILSLCSNGIVTNAKTHASGVGIRQVTLVAGARGRRNLPEIRCEV